MATTYQSPGVYVEEVDRGTKPIQGVGTSTTGFVGITAEASVKRSDPETGELIVTESRLNKPTLVTSWMSYTKIFGEFVDGAYLPDAVYGYFANGGGACFITSIRALNESNEEAKAASVPVPAEKGDSFTVVSKIAGEVGNNLSATITHDVDGDGKATGTFTIKIGSQTVKNLSMKKSDSGFIGKAEFDAISIENIGAASAMPTEGTWLLAGGGSPLPTAAEFIGNATERTGINGFESVDDIRLVVCPDIMAGYDGSQEAKERVRGIQKAIVDHCELMKYRFAILDTPSGLNPQEVMEWLEFLNIDSSYAGLYYPWVEVQDINNGGTKLIPPSAHIAGVYNRVDSERGVHKAPANEVLRGVVSMEIDVSRREQDFLNPKGINCIRPFAGRGLRIWGARTLSSDGSWRYINVRRLFIFVAASMDQGLQWAVFEPHDATLWAKVRRDVDAFLRNVWGSGALFGNTPSEAYYVKCDGELNPAEVRDAGQLIIEVGISPVKPAEFVIFRLSQWAGMGSDAAE